MNNVEHGPCDYNGGPGSDQCPHGYYWPGPQTPALDVDVDACPCGHDDNAHVHYCSGTASEPDCGCNREYRAILAEEVGRDR